MAADSDAALRALKDKLGFGPEQSKEFDQLARTFRAAQFNRAKLREIDQRVMAETGSPLETIHNPEWGARATKNLQFNAIVRQSLSKLMGPGFVRGEYDKPARGLAGMSERAQAFWHALGMSKRLQRAAGMLRGVPIMMLQPSPEELEQAGARANFQRMGGT